MVNAYLMFNQCKRLVPDPAYEDEEEGITMTKDGLYYITHPSHPEITFDNSSIICVLTTIVKTYFKWTVDIIEIKVKYARALRHDVIMYVYRYGYCGLDVEFYYVFPHNNKIRIITSTKEHNIINYTVDIEDYSLDDLAFLDVDLDTDAGDLHKIIHEGNMQYTAFPKFMRNIEAYNDITFEFESEL